MGYLAEGGPASVQQTGPERIQHQRGPESAGSAEGRRAKKGEIWKNGNLQKYRQETEVDKVLAQLELEKYGRNFAIRGIR